MEVVPLVLEGLSKSRVGRIWESPRNIPQGHHPIGPVGHLVLYPGVADLGGSNVSPKGLSPGLMLQYVSRDGNFGGGLWDPFRVEVLGLCRLSKTPLDGPSSPSR